MLMYKNIGLFLILKMIMEHIFMILVLNMSPPKIKIFIGEDVLKKTF